MKILPLFVTHLYSFEPPDYIQQINQKASKFLLDLEKTSKTDTPKSNVGGWRKSLDNIEVTCLDALKAYCDLCFAEIYDDGSTWGRSSWCIINRSGDYNLPHSHAGNTWSCVYYVDAGDCSGKNGCLLLQDPRGSITDSNSDMFGISNMYITPKSGQLYIFPSWLVHQVLPYSGEKPRIIISTNFSFKG